MAKVCLHHKNQPAVTLCPQCHIPICKACVTVTPQGSYCSAECSVLHREMKAKLATNPRASGGLKFMLVVLALLMGIILFHFFARSHPSLRTFDLFGKVMGYPDERTEKP